MREFVLGGLLWAIAGCAQQPARAPVAAESRPAPDTPAQVAIERSVSYADLQPKQPIRIDNPYGDVRVRFGGYEHKFEWRTVAQNMDAAHKIGVTGTAGQAYTVAARLPQGEVLGRGQRVEITAYVPQGHDLEIVTELGLIEVRGLQANLKARSVDGNISFRGIAGLVDIETGAGMVEGQLDPAPSTSSQRIVTRTGNILLGIAEGLNARLALASSGVFATEFSVQIAPQPGQEPNKTGIAEIGKPEASIEVASKRGEIRLLRRAQFRSA